MQFKIHASAPCLEIFTIKFGWRSHCKLVNFPFAPSQINTDASVVTKNDSCPQDARMEGPHGGNSEICEALPISCKPFACAQIHATLAQNVSG